MPRLVATLQRVWFKPEHKWIQHRWPNGTGVGHAWFLHCSESCQPKINRTTTYHDQPPPLSWEWDD